MIKLWQQKSRYLNKKESKPPLASVHQTVVPSFSDHRELQSGNWRFSSCSSSTLKESFLSAPSPFNTNPEQCVLDLRFLDLAFGPVQSIGALALCIIESAFCSKKLMGELGRAPYVRAAFPTYNLAHVGILLVEGLLPLMYSGNLLRLQVVNIIGEPLLIELTCRRGR